MTDVRENREKFKRTLSDSRDEVTADVPASALAIGPPTTTRSHVFIATAVAVLICLYLTSLHSYLLFHALAETFSIVVACAIFFVAWNTRAFLGNNYLLFLGIAYLFVAGIDFLHMLAYKGMGVFEGYGANLPTQLWIAARYLESGSLLVAPLFLDRKIKPYLVLSIFSIVFGLLACSIFSWGIFPDCYVEGVGLTAFKKVSEYAISLMLAGSIVLLLRNRSRFEGDVLRLVIWSIVCTIGSELSFTFYVSVYGFSNLVGHYLKIVSFYLLYRAVIQTGLKRPVELLFRELKTKAEALADDISKRKLAEKALRKAQATLERRVEERTADLQAANARLLQEVEERKRSQQKLARATRALTALTKCNEALIRTSDESALLTEICHIIVEVGGYRMAWIAFVLDDEARTVHPVAFAGVEEGYLKSFTVALTDKDTSRRPIARAIKSGEPVIVKNVLTDPNFASWHREASARGYVSLIGLPIAIEGSVAGGMAIWAGEADAFDEEEVDLLTRFAEDLSYGVTALRWKAEREHLIADLETKNAELERFTYSVSHDLKSPLITIKSFLGYVRKDAVQGDLERLDQDLERIGNAARKMGQLLDELLELSRVGRLLNPSTKIAFDELARDAVELVAGELIRRRIDVSIAKELPVVYGDRPRLLQVVQNLVENSAKYMGTQEHPRVEIGVRSNGEQQVLYVRDNGMGIEAPYQERIFGLFEKLDASTEGTGAGLALVKRIVEFHRGSIWVESDGPGHGSTFCFTLPPREQAPTQ